VLAKQEGGQVLWNHDEPSGTSSQWTNANGVGTTRTEMDPLGTKVDENGGFSGGGFSVNPVGFYGDANNQGGGCAAGGAGAACTSIFSPRRSLGWGIGILIIENPGGSRTRPHLTPYGPNPVPGNRNPYGLIGNSESTRTVIYLSHSWNLGGGHPQNPDDWMNNDPDSIENTTPNCSIKVAFTGSSGFLDIQNGSGIRSDKLEGGGGYGLGFTVSGSVRRGEIGRVETPRETQIVNPHGSWTIQQYVANSTRQTFEETGDHVWYRGSPTAPDGPSAPLRTIQGNKFSYADFPGPSKNYGKGLGNLTDYQGEWDFAVKVIDGKQQCEVKFHISMSLNQGKWTAHWGSR
jgi:hypothetical protein